MILELDITSSVPLYQQIQSLIIEGIARGLLKPGQQLPSVRQLASELGVNLHTVNKAYQFLRDEGYVSLSSRSGAVIDLSKLDTRKFEARMSSILNELVAEAICHEVGEDSLNKIIAASFKDMNNASTRSREEHKNA